MGPPQGHPTKVGKPKNFFFHFSIQITLKWEKLQKNVEVQCHLGSKTVIFPGVCPVGWDLEKLLQKLSFLQESVQLAGT